MLGRVNEQCNHCGKFKSALEIWKMPGGATICPECQQAHDKGLQGLGQYISQEVACPVCRATKETVTKAPNGRDIPMYIHWMDGVQIPMCESCHYELLPKEAKHLYRGTAFGQEHKLG
jgi:hypothetical protein